MTSCSGVYEKLVHDDSDFLGQAAYSLYKHRKRGYIMRKQSELGVQKLPDEVIQEFTAAQDNYTLDMHRNEARVLSREFLNSSYQEELDNAVSKIKDDTLSKYEKPAENTKPASYWYGVMQSLTGSFLFVPAGYVLLRMSGSRDLIMNLLIPAK